MGTVQRNLGNQHFNADGRHGSSGDTSVDGTKFNWSGGAVRL